MNDFLRRTPFNTIHRQGLNCSPVLPNPVYQTGPDRERERPTHTEEENCYTLRPLKNIHVKDPHKSRFPKDPNSKHLNQPSTKFSQYKRVLETKNEKMGIRISTPPPRQPAT